MPRFRVKAGSHVQAGKVYPKGSVVESDVDLTKVFREKFEPLDKEQTEAERAKEKGGQLHKEDGSIPQSDEEKEQEKEIKSGSRRSRRHSSQ